jgi:hypothetical protein
MPLSDWLRAEEYETVFLPKGYFSSDFRIPWYDVITHCCDYDITMVAVTPQQPADFCCSRQVVLKSKLEKFIVAIISLAGN